MSLRTVAEFLVTNKGFKSCRMKASPSAFPKLLSINHLLSEREGNETHFVS